MESAYRLTHQYLQQKIQIYKYKTKTPQTVIKPECLNGSETLILNRKTGIDNNYKKEHKIIRKILVPILADEKFWLRSKQEIKHYNKHSQRGFKTLKPVSLTKQTVEFYENRSTAEKDTM